MSESLRMGTSNELKGASHLYNFRKHFTNIENILCDPRHSLSTPRFRYLEKSI